MPLPSGLVALVEQFAIFSSQKKSVLKIIYKKKYLFTVSRKITKIKRITFENDAKLKRNLSVFSLLIYIFEGIKKVIKLSFKSQIGWNREYNFVCI